MLFKPKSPDSSMKRMSPPWLCVIVTRLSAVTAASIFAMFAALIAFANTVASPATPVAVQLTTVCVNEPEPASVVPNVKFHVSAVTVVDAITLVFNTVAVVRVLRSKRKEACFLTYSLKLT